MTISALKRYFKAELSSLYTESESIFLSALFIHHTLGFNNFQQKKWSKQKLKISDEERLCKFISELKTGKPYQQILGETEFFRMKFFVNENVLIPRPETEELLEIAIQEIKNKKADIQDLKILDIGTGSGVISLVLKKHFPNAQVYSIDSFEKALETARRNADYHQLKIKFIHVDYLRTELNESYDIIISNPPYIGIEEEIKIADTVKKFEPKTALFSPTSDALVFYKKIAKDTHKSLKNEGLLFLEINQKLGSETLELYKHFSHTQLLKDLSDNDRFIYGRK